METLLNSLKSLSKLQIGVLVAVLVGSFGLTVGGNYLLRSSGEQELEENQRLIPIKFGTLVNEVAINGSITFSNKEMFKFGTDGIITEILVEEGEEVTAGQALVSLDAETVAQLQEAVAQARLDLLDAEHDLSKSRNSTLAIADAEAAVSDAKVSVKDAVDSLDDLQNPDAQTVAQAEASVSSAEVALMEAQDELDDIRAPDSQTIAEAEAAVVQATIERDSAQRSVSQDIVDAVVAVDVANRDLEAARQSLILAPNEDTIRRAQRDFKDAQNDYLAVFKQWTGAALEEDELLLSPDEIFDAWGFNPTALYDSSYNFFPERTLRDNDETRWNELTIYAWVSLHPEGSSIEVTCDSASIFDSGNSSTSSATSSTSRGSRNSNQEFCIQRDFENTWQTYEDMIIEVNELAAQSERDVIRANSDLVLAEESLAESELALERLTNGPELELLAKNLAVSEATMFQAKIDLDDLTAPNQTNLKSKVDEVALAKANLDLAKDDLADLLQPNPVEVAAGANMLAVAEATLSQAETDLANLAKRQELEVALHEASVSSARAVLNAAEGRFDNSTLSSPWDGFVSVIEVEKGQEVGRTTDIIEVINPSIVQVAGVVDEIDVLSLSSGSQATVTMDALPNQTLSGSVTNISSSGTSQQGVVTFAVDIEVTIPQGLRLQEGLSAVANVKLNEESGLLVPNQSIKGTFQVPQVQIINGSGFESKTVRLGSTDGFWTIVYDGLSEGDQIVLDVEDTDTEQVGFRGFGGGNRGGGGPPRR